MSQMDDDVRDALTAAVTAGVTSIEPDTVDDLTVWLVGSLSIKGWTKDQPAPRIQLPRSPGPRP